MFAAFVGSSFVRRMVYQLFIYLIRFSFALFFRLSNSLTGYVCVPIEIKKEDI